MQAQIVEDLLDISRIVNGKLRLSVRLFSPQVSVEAAIEALRPAAMAKNISLQLIVDPTAGPISGDPERLQQVVWNLLSNAIKFTPKGGRVQLTLNKVDSNVQIIVSDNGAGVPSEYLPRIFDTFTQVDSTSTRKHGGLGLGLAIVKKLVELHGGCVSVSSPGVGKGSMFTVSLPLAALKGDVLSPSPGPEPVGRFTVPENIEEFGLTGAIILLVQDDDDARDMLASVLLSAQATVETASNAYEALTLYEGLRPDLIVSDIGMPDMDGYEFIAELRKRERALGLAGVPAVALTAYARIQDRMRALTSGFQMHVAKPVEPAELLTVLSSLRPWKIPQ